MPSFRFSKVILLFAALALLAAAGGGFFLYGQFQRAQPHYSGHAELPGLAADVRVYRDEYGVPHIFAASLDDAARALGYIHADERLFQMEMNRRAGAGRLSEVLGSSMLDVDEFTRTMGFYRLAASSFKILSPAAQKLLRAYADGVNAWLAQNRDALPPEFAILGIKSEPWTPPDSLVWAKLMALQLSSNYKIEMLRARLSSKLTPQQMKILFPLPPGNTPITTEPHLTNAAPLRRPPVRPVLQKIQPVPAPGKRGERDAPSSTLAALEKLGTITGLRYAASNEWVVSGARTESGKPILANDPHLGLEAPVLWYLARITTPEMNLTGATVPGLPVVLLGHNDHIAWGFTTTGNDVEDLFIETVDPDNSKQYLAPGGALPFEARNEVIKVHGGLDKKLVIRSTRHGPVLSDIDDDLADLAGDGKVMALAFTALGGEDTTPEALMRLNRAQNWQDFLAALRLYQAPPQNIVYADTAGDIGFMAPGIVPVRKKGRGLVPADGASGDYDWLGPIPFDYLPQLHNPPAGFVFNANNAVTGPGLYFHGADWEEPYRAIRLQQFFDRIGKHSLATSAAMQADHVSMAAVELAPYLLRQRPTDQREKDALALLAKWDFTMDRERPEPLLFEAWMYELHELMITKKFGDPLKAEGPYDAVALNAMLGENATQSCGQPKKGARWCDAEILEALRRAVDFLRARDGMDMQAWRWGKEHMATLAHKFYSHLPILDKMTTISGPSSGDFYTLDRGGSGEVDPRHPFIRTHGGGFRGIYDLSDLDRSRFMIATGESGHILSKHYRDLFEAWNNVQSFTLAGSEEDLAKRKLPLLEFSPAAAKH